MGVVEGRTDIYNCNSLEEALDSIAKLLKWFKKRNMRKPKISANFVKFEMRNFVEKFGGPN